MFQSRISLLALTLGLGLSAPVFAQDTTTPAPAAETPPAVDTTAPGLSMGVDVGGAAPAGDQPGTFYTSGTFGDWTQRCLRTGQDADPCELFMLLNDSEGNNVAEVSIFNLPAGVQGPAVAGATFTAPMETLLTEGVVMVIDAGKARAYPYTACTAQGTVGCVSRIGFTNEEIAALKKGGKVTFTIVPFVAPDQRVALEASLNGFTAGYDAMVAANKAVDEKLAAAAKAAAEAAPTEAPAQQ